MKESRHENILHARRMTETQRLDNLTEQDKVSIGLSTQAQDKWLRATAWAFDRVMSPRKRSE